MKSNILIFFLANIVVALARTTRKTTSTSFASNLQNSMRTLGGLNCLVESALEVQNSVNGFVDEFKECNVEQTETISTILDDCNLLKVLADRVVEVNNDICKNAEYNETSDDKKRTSARCGQEMKRQMTHLYNFLEYSLNDDLQQPIRDICSKNAANDLLMNLKYFPEAVERCANTFKRI